MKIIAIPLPTVNIVTKDTCHAGQRGKVAHASPPKSCLERLQRDIILHQGSGISLAQRGMDASYLKMAFHESHTIGHWCCVGPQNLLIQYKLDNSGYMTTEDDINGNFERPLWRYSLFCNALNKNLLRFVYETESQMQS